MFDANVHTQLLMIIFQYLNLQTLASLHLVDLTLYATTVHVLVFLNTSAILIENVDQNAL